MKLFSLVCMLINCSCNVCLISRRQYNKKCSSMCGITFNILCMWQNRFILIGKTYLELANEMVDNKLNIIVEQKHFDRRNKTTKL